MRSVKNTHLNLRKAARFAIVINTAQIVTMLAVLFYVWLSDKSSDRIVEIGAKACKGNKKLAKVIFGYATKKVGKQAFYKCKKLKMINVYSTSYLLFDIGKGKAPGIAKKAFTGAGIKTVKCGYTLPRFKNNTKKALVAKGLSKKAKIVK